MLMAPKASLLSALEESTTCLHFRMVHMDLWRRYGGARERFIYISVVVGGILLAASQLDPSSCPPSSFQNSLSKRPW
jgi:hypothetical protein